MKLGILFSGGKDSTYAAWISNEESYDICCLISIVSKNKESFMFHVPSISKVEAQARVMNIPIIMKDTEGIEEEELKDLKEVIIEAKEKYNIQGIVTGAVGSVYQASRVQRICNELNLECFNPLWQKNQEEILRDLIKNNFKVVLSGVFAYPFNKFYLGREIDEKLIEEMKNLNEKFKINIAGEGGEYESFVLNCPLFNKSLEIEGYEDFGEENGYSWRRELKIK